MSRVYAVIGANYGDEGKGLMTDYLASKDPQNSIVIRHNGGAQAGHTVLAPDGRRHVFSHFGSASFLDCPTFLSRFFILNPMIYCKELEELKALGLSPQTYLDASAIITTPIDVLINQLVEMQRGNERHGSCGLGINETVTRCQRSPEYRTILCDFLSRKHAMKVLQNLLNKYLPARLQEHRLNENMPALQAFLSSSKQIFCRYLDDIETMMEDATLIRQCPEAKAIIFEGAQGLLLDEARLDKFPHLTRSRTGLTNILALLPELSVKIDSIEVKYMSRTYLTKHGAGPLANEADFSFPDATNITNQFQGHLRFANLDLEELNYSIELDLKQARKQPYKLEPSLVFTCLDQMSLPEPNKLILPVSHMSYGPSRCHVERTLALAA